jgi:hypothetical protein
MSNLDGWASALMTALRRSEVVAVSKGIYLAI